MVLVPSLLVITTSTFLLLALAAAVSELRASLPISARPLPFASFLSPLSPLIPLVASAERNVSKFLYYCYCFYLLLNFNYSAFFYTVITAFDAQHVVSLLFL